MSKSQEPIHLRFQAVVIASQLPANTAEALLVLEYARHMVMEFLNEPTGVSDNVQAVSGRTLRPSLIAMRWLHL
jgi:hypothetical protein